MSRVVSVSEEKSLVMVLAAPVCNIEGDIDSLAYLIESGRAGDEGSASYRCGESTFLPKY